MEKCNWCKDGGRMETYHDREWGIPLHDDRKHFEYLMMEVMQCGLNWNMMLKKRETFRKCFDDFNYEKIVLYDETKIQSIMETDDMIRSIRKIRAVIGNAAAYKKVIGEFGSFSHFLWSYTNHRTVIYRSHHHCMTASNDLSDSISRELKKRGFKYLGSVTVYAHLQACGIVNDHAPDCFRYKDILENYPVEFRD